MVDILQVLEGLAYVGFIAGAIFAVMELRSISKDRKLELFVRLSEQWNSREFSQAMVNLGKADFQNAETAERTCPTVDLVMIAEYFDWVASLARKNLISEDFIMSAYDFEFPWNLMKPWCLDWRKRMAPSQLSDFEWIAGKQRTWRQASEWNAIYQKRP